MFLLEVTCKDDFFTEFSNLVLLGRLLIGCHTDELLRSLDVIGILVQQTPAAQVVETVSLIRQFHGTFATQLLHEGGQIAIVAHTYGRHTGTLAYLVHSLKCSQRCIIAARRRTISCGCSLGIHQVDIGQAHPGQMDMILMTPAVAIVKLVAVLIDELQQIVTRARATNHVTVLSIGLHVGIAPLLVGSRKGSLYQLETIENDVVIEARVTAFPRMCLVETRGHIAKWQSIGHAVGIIDIIGCWQVCHTGIVKVHACIVVAHL